MIKNSVPLSDIPNLSPEEKQNHLIGLFTSIDETLKKILLWSEPSAGAGMVEMQYEKEFGQAVNFDLRDLHAGAVGAVKQAAEKIAAAKPRASRKTVETALAPVTDIQQVPAEETTLAPVQTETAAPAPAPVAVVAVTSEVTIDTLRKAAQKFILDLTAQGQVGKDVFSGLLKAQGAQILSALDKSKYSALLAEMAKIVPAVAEQAFDTLA